MFVDLNRKLALVLEKKMDFSNFLAAKQKKQVQRNFQQQNPPQQQNKTVQLLVTCFQTAPNPKIA